MNRPVLVGLLLVVLCVVADQAIKALVVATMALGSAVELLPFLALLHARNEGIAFSLFAGFDDLALAGLAGLVLGFVVWLWVKTPADRRLSQFAFAIIVGGAIGNLIDRVLLGYVVDYVYFHTPVWSFAVFNLADALISVGAALIVLDEFVLEAAADRSEGRSRVGLTSGFRALDRGGRDWKGEDMTETFKAILISRGEDKKQSVAVVDMTPDELMDGDVDIAVEATTVNYKDGLAITGKSPVVRRWPMIPGVDLAGTVISSTHAAWKSGDKVVLNGWGVGEVHYGAYAGRARLSGDWLVPLPSAFTCEQAMAIGTAGYTAMLSVMALEAAGVTPAHGPVVVTGASGGVGSVAVAILSKLGWHVIASTGRPEEADFLTGLGAAEIVDRKELSEPGKPLAKERWAAGVDAVGSHTLANVLAQTKYHGAVACCGLAQGMDLPGSVAPFILRGVSLLGIDSVMAPKEKRLEAWSRLATDLDPARLEAITTRIGFDDIVDAAGKIVEGKIRGRVVVSML